MSDNKAQAEPSMEEILASIRRILAEDEGVAPGPAQPRAPAGVLDLTEALNADGSVRHIALTVEPVASPQHPDGHREPTATRSPGRDAGSPLVSEAASDAVAAAFSRLAGVAADPRGPGEPDLGATVRELLRPMLQAWLDENLPGLVERLVEAEIARVVAGAARR